MGDERRMKEIIINTKEEYDKVQNELLAKGYKWIDGSDKYYDLFECANGFYKMRFVIHEEDKTFEWRFLKEIKEK
jgi:hypothetical protein